MDLRYAVDGRVGYYGNRPVASAVLTTASGSPESQSTAVRAGHDHLRCDSYANTANRRLVRRDLSLPDAVPALLQYVGEGAAYCVLRAGNYHLHDIHCRDDEVDAFESDADQAKDQYHVPAACDQFSYYIDGCLTFDAGILRTLYSANSAEVLFLYG